VSLYYVNIPVYISEGKPEITRRPDKVCYIGVRAPTPLGALARVSEALERAVKNDEALSICGWQECEEQAVIVRDTPWGDLHVCSAHEHTPLELEVTE
jgi:hypothetical protein